MFKPTKEDLVRLGISSTTYSNNDFFIAKFTGVYKWNSFYSAAYFFCMLFGLATSVGFAYGAFLEGKKEAFLESIHFLPLLVNMVTQIAAYHYSQKDYIDLFQTIDKGFFDYGYTIDEVAKNEIAEIKSAAQVRKRNFGKFYTLLLCVAMTGHSTKKPVSYFLDGRGMKEIDGKNSLIWQGPFGMYFPYADYWISYLCAMVLCYVASFCVGATAIGSAVTFQYISEELISEYAIVRKTFKECVKRCETYYKIRIHEMTAASQPATMDNTMDDCLRHCLHLSIKHHHDILKLNNVFKRLMFVPLWMVVFDTALVLCISAYLIISKDVSVGVKVIMPGTILSELVMLLIYCYYGEKISQANRDVGDAIYNDSKWVDHSIVIKPYAVIIKSFCDIPNDLSAGGFTSVGHKTFHNVLSTAYSYIGYMLST